MKQTSMTINGFLFNEPRSFTKHSFEMFFDENEIDTLKIFNENGYKPLFEIGHPDYDLGIEVYKRYKQNGWKSTPTYMLEIWHQGSHTHDDVFFADSIVDFNFLLKEIEPILSIAKYFEQKENEL